MNAREQLKEWCQRYLDGLITETEFWNEALRIAYVHQDMVFTKWVAEQLLRRED